ncbi:hypothetical protein HanXRQr2_Chr04g0159211 [Helianthus annuus]|uniref:Uncharacterized protein n=1 Tax=Helianthus annuus TaxID=4232 RepID=A0A9K3J6Z5_HELAN|nr:hypothetical protein HanXRQr2_Chr04g0159211 [Helianthus annuus]
MCILFLNGIFFKACMSRELLLMKRNSFVYIFKTVQLTIIAVITMTVFQNKIEA